jgi:CRP-like cAMP-binding protein
MPVQAAAAAIEAGWLDPRSDSHMQEAVEATRTIGRPLRAGSGQALIAALDTVAREHFVARLLPVSFGTDVLFAREGGPSDAIWFVVRGRVRASRLGARGSPVTLGLVGPGGVVGESSLLGGGARIATLVCEEPTDLLELRRVDYEALVRAHPEVKGILERLERLGGERGGAAHVAA